MEGIRKMLKYGRGLNREIVAAVNSGLVSEPFSVSDVRRLIEQKNWNPGPTENYITVTLANGASINHSHTYKKYFVSLREGYYKLRPEFIGDEWS